MKLVKTDKVISSACFPLRNGEVIDLETAFLDLKNYFNCREVLFNDKFYLLCIKLDRATVNVSYKGKIKFFSVLPTRDLERLCFDLWADVFKKNVKKTST